MRSWSRAPESGAMSVLAMVVSVFRLLYAQGLVAPGCVDATVIDDLAGT